MKTTESKLSNGINLVTTKMPESDMVTVRVIVDAGTLHEKEFEPGIAHFLEHARFKSTKTRSAREISKEIEILGCNFNAYTTNDHTAYYATGLNSSFEKIIEILGDITCNSIFPEEEIETERQVVLQEISMYADRIDALAEEAFNLAAYAEQSISLPTLGTSEFIKSVTNKDLKRFVKDHYFAENITISIAGNIDHKCASELVEKYFSSIQSKKKKKNPKFKFTARQIIKSGDFEQFNINIGFNLGKNDEFDFTSNLAAIAFGGGMSSPLFDEVREKRGLVYGTFATSIAYPDNDVFILDASTTPDNYKALIETFGSCIINANDLVTKDDITRAKNSILVKFAQQKNSSSVMSAIYGGQVRKFGKVMKEFSKFPSLIESVTEDQIRDYLGKLKAADFAVGIGGSKLIEGVDVIGDMKNIMG